MIWQLFQTLRDNLRARRAQRDLEALCLEDRLRRLTDDYEGARYYEPDRHVRINAGSMDLETYRGLEC